MHTLSCVRNRTFRFVCPGLQGYARVGTGPHWPTNGDVSLVGLAGIALGAVLILASHLKALSKKYTAVG